MKIRISVAVIALFTAFNLYAVDSTAEAVFIQKARSAIDAHDQNALFSLVYLDGVEPSMKQMLQKQMSAIVSKPVKSISLVDSKPDQKFECIRKGITYRTNLIPVKMLKIDLPDTDAISNSSMSLPVGEHTGVLFITTAIPVKTEQGAAANP